MYSQGSMLNILFYSIIYILLQRSSVSKVIEVALDKLLGKEEMSN